MPKNRKASTSRKKTKKQHLTETDHAVELLEEVKRLLQRQPASTLDDAINSLCTLAAELRARGIVRADAHIALESQVIAAVERLRSGKEESAVAPFGTYRYSAVNFWLRGAIDAALKAGFEVNRNAQTSDGVRTSAVTSSDVGLLGSSVGPIIVSSVVMSVDTASASCPRLTINLYGIPA